MKKAAEIKSQIAKLEAEVQAIVELSTEEDRELSAEEAARVDAIQGIEDQPGEIANLRKEYERSVRFENRVKDIAGSIEFKQDPPEDTENSIKPFSIPAKAKNQGRLKAFRGEDAERHAFIAGQACLAGIYNQPRAVEFCRNHGLVRNDMLEGQGQKGGFLVPDEMQSAIVRLREERGVFEQFARVVPMGSDNIFVPREINDVTAYWVGEGDEITASDSDLGAAELTAKKLGALVKVSSELDEDAIVEIGDMITRQVAYAQADKIDEAGFNGDGTSTYGGVTGLKTALDSNAIQDAASGNTGAKTLDLADFEDAVGLLPQYPGMTAAWYVHSAVYFASMGRLMNAAGGNTTENLGDGPVRQFLGYPVRFTQVLPSTTGASTSTILAYFGDLSLAATVGRRRQVNTQVSVDRYFENDLIGIRATQRLAINVHERGDTVRTRPIVALKTASS